MPRNKRHSFWFALGAAALLSLTSLHRGDAMAPAALTATDAKQVPLRKNGAGYLPMPPGVPSAHASHLSPLSDKHPGSVAAVWFAGDRESAPNVQIAFSYFDPASQDWMPARLVVERHHLGNQLGHGVRRLGNPVIWMDAQDRLHLFVVATGLGGWAAARIVHLEQDSDTYALDALSFKPRGVLPLSWLWNTSHLVRNSAMMTIDGGLALPVYFELGAKYPLQVNLDASGHLNRITRISTKRNLLQPAIVPLDGQHWMAYMRMSGGTQRVAAAETRDAGAHWQDMPDLALPNPNAAVAALNAGQLLMAFNPETSSRQSLSLAASTDGRGWSTFADLERGSAGDEFSYPSLAWADDALWVSYTYRREKIAWQRFTATGKAGQ